MPFLLLDCIPEHQPWVNSSQVDYIAPSEVPGLLREELPQLKQ